MSEGTQSMGVSSAKAPVAAAAVVGLNAARPSFWYQSSLLRLWGGNAAKLLLRQSSLLRLWADTAPKPLFEFQSSLLRLCADNCELVARRYEECVEAFGTAVEQQQFGTLLQNFSTRLSEGSEDHGGPIGRREVSPSSGEARQENKSFIDQMSDPAAEAVGTLSEKTVEVAADQAKMAVRHDPVPLKEAAKSVSGAANARQQTAAKKAPHKAHPDKRVSSTRKIPRKTMKSRKKTGRE
jgi:hypothetical protein